MRQRLRCGLMAAALALGASCGQAETVIAEGVATVQPGGLAPAREEAIRNALADAARQASLTVEARSGSGNHQAAFDQVVIRSGVRVERHRILAESEQDGVYRVRLSAELSASSGHAGPVCR